MTHLAYYAIGDALADAVNEFRTALLNGGHVSIGVHDLSRDRFDLLPGEEKHHDSAATTEEFWSKNGFDWSSDNHDGKDRHRVYVAYFTKQPPVVVPIAPSVSSDPRDGYALGDPKRIVFDRGPNGGI